jgi:hypothetical protein
MAISFFYILFVFSSLVPDSFLLEHNHTSITTIKRPASLFRGSAVSLPETEMRMKIVQSRYDCILLGDFRGKAAFLFGARALGKAGEMNACS